LALLGLDADFLARGGLEDDHPLALCDLTTLSDIAHIEGRQVQADFRQPCRGFVDPRLDTFGEVRIVGLMAGFGLGGSGEVEVETMSQEEGEEN
jgi:hypothetical protein